MFPFLLEAIEAIEATEAIEAVEAMEAIEGIEAIEAFAKDGTKPAASDGLTFFNTGVNLVTDSPADGVPSIDSTKGTELCWG